MGWLGLQLPLWVVDERAASFSGCSGLSGLKEAALTFRGEGSRSTRRFSESVLWLLRSLWQCM